MLLLVIDYECEHDRRCAEHETSFRTTPSLSFSLPVLGASAVFFPTFHATDESTGLLFEPVFELFRPIDPRRMLVKSINLKLFIAEHRR